ncbi:hypothetical protein Tco_0673890 [Tanacetum coccineum]
MSLTNTLSSISYCTRSNGSAFVPESAIRNLMNPLHIALLEVEHLSQLAYTVTSFHCDTLIVFLVLGVVSHILVSGGGLRKLEVVVVGLFLLSLFRINVSQKMTQIGGADWLGLFFAFGLEMLLSSQQQVLMGLSILGHSFRTAGEFSVVGTTGVVTIVEVYGPLRMHFRCGCVIGVVHDE